MISNVLIINRCAWNKEEEVTLKIPLASYYGLASIYYDRGAWCVTVKVKCIKLDDILREFESIKLVKIDVEGAEFEVLEGMTKSLSKIKYIILEISRNARDIIEFLRRHGFKIKKLGFTTYIIACRESCLSTV